MEAVDAARIAHYLFEIMLADMRDKPGPKTRRIISEDDRSQDLRVVGSIALAHAVTIYISHTHKVSLAEALRIQTEPDGKDAFVVDVDLECVNLLRARMFREGQLMWGRATPGHQDGWDPCPPRVAIAA